MRGRRTLATTLAVGGILLECDAPPSAPPAPNLVAGLVMHQTVVGGDLSRGKLRITNAGILTYELSTSSTLSVDYQDPETFELGYLWSEPATVAVVNP